MTSLFFILTHFQTTNCRPPKPKEFADDNSEFDENGKKFSKRIKNAVGKEENARFLLPRFFTRFFFFTYLFYFVFSFQNSCTANM